MFYFINVGRRFSAAHRLEGHPGKCSQLHGHTWYVNAVFAGEELGPGGILIDFDDAGEVLDEIVADLDHTCLNEVEPFNDIAPTAENVARVVFERLKAAAKRRSSWKNARLAGVTVWESPGSSATVAVLPHLPSPM